jgi:hypothetical protein
MNVVENGETVSWKIVSKGLSQDTTTLDKINYEKLKEMVENKIYGKEELNVIIEKNALQRMPTFGLVSTMMQKKFRLTTGKRVIVPNSTYTLPFGHYLCGGNAIDDIIENMME